MSRSKRTEKSPMRAGETALRQGAWSEARRQFNAALRSRQTPEALEGLGWAEWWLDRPPASFAARERAYALYRRRGDRRSAYSGTTLERPPSLAGNDPGVVYPWEQIFVALAACAGSDYPMLAAHDGVRLECVELIVEGLFDPRGEFDGLAGFTAPADSARCFLALHLHTRLRSPAARQHLERIHARVLSHNMVLGALRGIPITNELTIEVDAPSVAPSPVPESTETPAG